jgi:hypothetical protein
LSREFTEVALGNVERAVTIKSRRDGPLLEWQKGLDAFYWEVDESGYATADAIPKRNILSQFGSRVRSVCLNVTCNLLSPSGYEDFIPHYQDIGWILRDFFSELTRVTIEDPDNLTMMGFRQGHYDPIAREHIEAACASEKVHESARDGLR